MSSNAVSDRIRFYKAEENPYGVFCNYRVTPIVIDGKEYKSVEHYYQSQKFHGTNENYEEKVRQAVTPHQSKVLGTMYVSKNGYAWRMALNPTIQEALNQGVKIRSDWESVKEDVMMKALRVKFSTYPKYAHLLLSTGDKTIEENSPIDSIWGIGQDGLGMNKLGNLLMKLRTELKD